MGDVIGGIGSLVGGIMGAGAANKAAKQEAAAIQQGVDFQKMVYGQGQQNLSPWIGAGQQALTSLLGFYGLPGGNASGATQAFQQFQQTPFYQFPLQQGQLGINRQLASMGLSNSGAALKDASQYNAGYASSGLTNYLSGLGGLSSGGQSAAGTLLQGGNQAAQNIGSLYTNQGVAQASGTIGANNALQKGISGALGPLGQFGNGLFGGTDPTNGSSSSYNAGSWLGGALGTGNGTVGQWQNDIAAYNSNWNNFGSEWGYPTGSS